MDLIIVTGMSGAGKSQAVNALEDMGFYCVDNVPPSLLSKFAELPAESQGKITRIALVVDVRSRGMFSDLLHCLDDLTASRYEYSLLFLDCDEKVLATRYKETRRRHPLLGDSSSVPEAITAEKAMLAPVREAADFIIDTSLVGVAQLKNRIRELFSNGSTGSMVVTCMSFGFKYGIPVDSDLVFDVRCLPNPFYIDSLRELTGLDAPVREYVLGNDDALSLRDKLLDLFDMLIPLYIREGKSQLVVSMGCTGGKHRSVVFAEALTRHLSAKGISTGTTHRDILK
ncbi:RNase adapter RapZ [Ruminococcaceae bacterium OttesenSCG-928-L11]|nr:RNase adapter RapZ [Ruminococcaceae bacterium OttesenSCG-928-L11]